jgi:hypothetical protein
LPGLAVAWLKEARTPVKVLESGMPATVIPVMGGLIMATVTIGVDPHKASHTAVAISALRRFCRVVAGIQVIRPGDGRRGRRGTASAHGRPGSRGGPGRWLPQK